MILLDELSAVVTSVLTVFFPRQCDFCGSSLPDSRPLTLCTECIPTLRWIVDPVCERCGSPFTEDHPATTCRRCLRSPPPYDRARFAVQYEGRLRDTLLRFKYGANLNLRRVLAQVLLDAFEQWYCAADFDLVVPVPVHRSKLRSRGFNQAVILAADLAEAAGILMCRRTLVKVRATRPQVGLSRAERISNLSGSFGVSGAARVRGRRILLVDDVSTTGTTISEATRTLKAAGAASISAMILATPIIDIDYDSPGLGSEDGASELPNDPADADAEVGAGAPDVPSARDAQPVEGPGGFYP